MMKQNTANALYIKGLGVSVGLKTNHFTPFCWETCVFLASTNLSSFVVVPSGITTFQTTSTPSSVKVSKPQTTVASSKSLWVLLFCFLFSLTNNASILAGTSSKFFPLCCPEYISVNGYQVLNTILGFFWKLLHLFCKKKNILIYKNGLAINYLLIPGVKPILMEWRC